MSLPLHWETIISAATLIGLGVFYGDVRARLGRIEKVVFNGQFVDKESLGVRVEDAEREHAEFRRRIEQLENKP